MKKFYFSFWAFILLSSCGTRIDYIGTAYGPTRQVDVFVSRDAIKKPFDVIGKGYIRTSLSTSFGSLEKVQRKAVAKAKQKGADAVIVKDYLVMNTDNSITTTSLRDSSRKNVVAASAAHPSVSNGFHIYFIRYAKQQP